MIDKMVKALRDLAGIGIVNAHHDTQTIREAADMIEHMAERIAIMSECKFAPDANFDGLVWHDPQEQKPNTQDLVLIAYREPNGQRETGFAWWGYGAWHTQGVLVKGEQIYAWARKPMPPTDPMEDPFDVH